MQYAMLAYHPAHSSGEVSESEHNCRQDGLGWCRQLEALGKCSGVVRLQPTTTATTLREGAGRLLLTDGPFAETKEVLGGFVILEVADLDEAIKLARTFPSLAKGGTVELRPVMVDGVKRAEG